MNNSHEQLYAFLRLGIIDLEDNDIYEMWSK